MNGPIGKLVFGLSDEGVKFGGVWLRSRAVGVFSSNWEGGRADIVSLETVRNEPFILEGTDGVLGEVGFPVDGHGIRAVASDDRDRGVGLITGSDKIRSGGVDEACFWFLSVTRKKHFEERVGAGDKGISNVGDQGRVENNDRITLTMGGVGVFINGFGRPRTTRVLETR